MGGFIFRLLLAGFMFWFAFGVMGFEGIMAIIVVVIILAVCFGDLVFGDGWADGLENFSETMDDAKLNETAEGRTLRRIKDNSKK